RQVERCARSRRALEDYRAARPHQLEGPVKPGAVARAIDYHVEARVELVFKLYFKSERSQAVELVAMMPLEHGRVALGMEHDCGECAQASVAEHRNPVVSAQFGLLENSVDRSERLDEDAELVGYRVGKRNQVSVREPQEFGERAVPAQNPQHGAVGAMASQALQAWDASPTRSIDFAHHASSGERGGLGVDDFADELM